MSDLPDAASDPTGANPLVVVHPGAELLAAATAARLVTRLADVLAARDVAHLVVTGGTVGIALLAAVRDCPAHAAVEWPRVHVWWGDERFLPAGHPDRNETQARRALLDHLPFEPHRVHPVPAPSADTPDPESAAASYSRLLAEHATSGPTPVFDVLLLGLGPDGHIASLFPGHPALGSQELSVIGVHGSPKPPPERVSLTLPAIRRATEGWFVAAGAEKAAAVTRSLGEPDQQHTPASTVTGQHHTLWLLDHPATPRGLAGGQPPAGPT